MYDYLALSKQHPHCILGGNWNADPIRNSSAQDRQQVRFLADMQAAACNPIPMTGATQYPGAVDNLPSCIDAFMISTTCKALKPRSKPLQSTGASDHVPVLMTLPDANAVLTLPPVLPKGTFEPRLRRVQKRSALLAFKEALELKSAVETTALHHKLVVAGQMEPSAYPEQVEALGTELVQLLLDQAMPLAGELLDWTQPPPEKGHASRKTSKNCLTGLRKRWALGEALSAFRSTKADIQESLTPTPQLMTLAKRYQHLAKNWLDLPMPPDHDAAVHSETWLDEWESWAGLAQQTLDQLPGLGKRGAGQATRQAEKGYSAPLCH